MSERARELLGFEGSRQRYADIQSVRDLEDISDPTTIDDETASGIRGYFAEHKIAAVAFSLIAVVGTVLLLAFAWQFVPLIVTNPLFIGGLVAIGIFLFGRRNGWRANQRRIEDIDELVLHVSDHLKPFKGAYIEGGRDSPPMFIPIKGYRKPGMRPEPYTVEEVDPSLIERSEGSIDPTAPAVIRLHPQFEESRTTETGMRVCQLTDGIQPDNGRSNTDGGRLSVLKASAPTTADPDKVEEIVEQNEQLTKDKKDLKDEKTQLQSKIEDLRDRLYDPVDERVEQQLDRVKDVLSSARGRSSTADRDGDGRRVTTPSPDAERERTKDEVEAD